MVSLQGWPQLELALGELVMGAAEQPVSARVSGCGRAEVGVKGVWYGIGLCWARAGQKEMDAAALVWS